jgi:ligand-binding sensor domain-containing protein
MMTDHNSGNDKLKPVDIAFRAKELAGVKATGVVERGSSCFWIATSGSGVSRFDFNSQLWQTFTEADGLANIDVRSILLTQAGNLWFGTANGASHFMPSTQQWRNFFMADGLPNNSVWSLLEDTNARIWFGTNGGGLCCYDEANNHWQTYSVETSGLAGNVIQALTEDTDGNIWAGTKTGLSRFNLNTGEWTNFHKKDGLADNQIRSLALDDSGHLWIGTVAGLNSYQLTNGSWATYGTADGLGSDYIQALAYRVGDTLWAGTREGISAYDPNTKKWKTYTQKDGLTDNEVWRLFIDSEDRLWIPTWGGGVSLFYPEQDKWVTYTTESGFADTYALSVIKSADAHVWIGTYGAISRYEITTGNWHILSSAENLPNNNVQTLAEDKIGNLWVGTSDGLIRYQQKEDPWKTYNPLSAGMNSDNIQALLINDQQQTKETIWAGTDQGLYRFSPGNGTWEAMSNPSLSKANVHCLFLDHTKNLWVGTTSGLIVMAPDSTVKTYNKADGLLNPQVNALTEDLQGRIWIGTEGGLNAFTPATGQWEAFSHADGLANDKVRALLIDEEELWAGCATGGLSSYQMKTKIWQSLEGLGSYDLTCLALDAEKKLWITSTGGGATWISRTGPEAGFVQVFTAGMQLFANQLKAFSHDIVVGRPHAFSVNQKNQPLAGAQVYSVYHNPVLAGAHVDEKNLIWAGSDEKGLSLTILENGIRKTAKHLPSRHIKALSAATHGDVWVGTSAGFARVQHNTMSVEDINAYPKVPCGPVSAIAAASDQEAYIGFDTINPIIFTDAVAAQTRSNTTIWQYKTGECFKSLLVTPIAAASFASCEIRNMVWNPHSGLWVATSAGLYHAAPEHTELKRIAICGNEECSILQVAVSPDGSPYILVDANSENEQIFMSKFDKNHQNPWVHVPIMNTHGVTTSTPAALISAIDVSPEGHLWASRGQYLFTRQ